MYYAPTTKYFNLFSTKNTFIPYYIQGAEFKLEGLCNPSLILFGPMLAVEKRHYMFTVIYKLKKHKKYNTVRSSQTVLIFT